MHLKKLLTQKQNYYYYHYSYTLTYFIYSLIIYFHISLLYSLFYLYFGGRPLAILFVMRLNSSTLKHSLQPYIISLYRYIFLLHCCINMYSCPSLLIIFGVLIFFYLSSRIIFVVHLHPIIQPHCYQPIFSIFSVKYCR